MSEADAISPAGTIVLGAEILVGLAALWLWVLRPKARRSARVQLTPWNLAPIDFGCFLGFVIVGAVVPSALAGWILRSVHASDDVFLIAGSAVLDLGILLGLAAFLLTYGPVRSNFSGGVNTKAALVKGGVATFLIAIPFVEAASLAWRPVLTALHLPTEEQDSVRVLEGLHSGGLVVSFALAAIVLAPIAEEHVFRGGLFRYFRTRGPRWLALLLTSVLFAAVHNSWVSLAPLTVLAVVFCLAYERTGSIWTTIIAHALFNVNTLVLVLMGTGS